MSKLRAKLNYAFLTDTGRRRLSNEDASYSDPQLGLFIVSDGLGDLPAGEAASEVVSHAFARMLRRRLRRQPRFDPADVLFELAQTAIQLSQTIDRVGRPLPTLHAMGATLVAGLISRQRLYVVNVGDSRAYLARHGVLERLTHDQILEHTAADGSRSLSQCMGVGSPPEPEVRVVSMEPGDRLILATDGLSDITPEPEILQALHDATPAAACRNLQARARARGGGDNLTVVVVEHQGLTEDAAPPPPRSPRVVRRASREELKQLDEALVELEMMLKALRTESRRLVGLGARQAIDAVRRMLTPEALQHVQATLPGGAGALWAYHVGVTWQGSIWRQRYDRHLEKLNARLADASDGAMRISPFFTAAETGAMLTRIWQSWRRVERRYFARCANPSEPDSASPDDLIRHMTEAAGTLRGLLGFLPRFRPEPGGRPAGDPMRSRQAEPELAE